MGEVLPFNRGSALSLPHQRGKTLVIEEDVCGEFVVSMRPAHTDRERALVSVHKTVEEARAVARHARRTFPGLYIAIVDKTLPDLGGAA